MDSEIHTYNASKKRLIDLVVYLNRPYLMMVVYNTSFLEFQFSIRSCIHYDSNPTLHPSTEFINSSLSVSLFPLVIYKVCCMIVLLLEKQTATSLFCLQEGRCVLCCIERCYVSFLPYVLLF